MRPGRSARQDLQVSERLPKPPSSGGTRVGIRGRPRCRALKEGSPFARSVPTPLLGRPRVPELPLPPEPSPLSPTLPGSQREAPSLDSPESISFAAGRVLYGPQQPPQVGFPDSRDDFPGLRSARSPKMTRFSPRHRARRICPRVRCCRD